MVGFENELKVEVIEFLGYFIHDFSLGLFIYCAWMLYLHVYVCITCVPSANLGPKKACDPL